jgi:hypothetical protein
MQRLVFFVFVPLSAFLCPFRRLIYASQSRTESSPGALRSFCALETKRHQPQLAQRCSSAACAAFRACRQLRLLLLLRFYCGLHEATKH